MLQPLVVDGSKALGNDSELTILKRPQRSRRQRRHLDEPLRRDQRLDDGVTSLAISQRDLIIFHLFQETQITECGDDTLSRLEAILPGKDTSGLGHLRIEADDLDPLQVVPIADL